MRVLGVNAVFHDPAAALVIDGITVAAEEEERFSRRKHGKPPVAFSTWELPEQAMTWCLAEAGIAPADLDAVAYSYDPDLAFQPNGDITAAEWEGLRTLYARRAPLFLKTALPGLDPERVRWVPHHVAHASSATFASGFEDCAVLVLDGRGERASHLQYRLEEVLIDLGNWLHERTGSENLVMAGGVALNCVANSRLWREGPFEDVWVQPASGDAGTALGGALYVAHELGE